MAAEGASTGGPPDAQAPVLAVDGLHVWFPATGGFRGGTLRAVDGIDFTLRRGTTLTLIGESGCGKTVTGQAVIGMLPASGRRRVRAMMLETRDGPVDLASLDPDGETMRRIRGRDVGMVFQDAASTLSPVWTIGSQLREAVAWHRHVGRRAADRAARELLQLVGVPDPGWCLAAYPHQLSGGLSQRVAIALALAGMPRVLIADEPTTALDVALQTQIVSVLARLQSELGLAVLFITHDLGLLRELGGEVAVMYLGRIVEAGRAETVLARPLHPYTVRLIDATPTVDRRGGTLPTIPGVVPRPIDLPMACHFAPRCDLVETRCHEAMPALVEVDPGHRVRCVRHHTVAEAETPPP